MLMGEAPVLHAATDKNYYTSNDSLHWNREILMYFILSNYDTLFFRYIYNIQRFLLLFYVSLI